MMNERIRELADESWNTFEIHGLEISAPYAFAERFAKLIVRECAEVALWEQGKGYDVGAKIKEHFGVE